MSTQTDPSPLADPDRASAAGGSSNAQDRAQQATGQAQEKAQQAAGQAQEKAQQAAGQAQAKLREQLDQRSTQLAEQVDQQASDLRSVSEALRDQGKDRPAEVVDRLAGYGEQAGSYLRDNDVTRCSVALAIWGGEAGLGGRGRAPAGLCRFAFPEGVKQQALLDTRHPTAPGASC